MNQNSTRVQAQVAFLKERSETVEKLLDNKFKEILAKIEY